MGSLTAPPGTPIAGETGAAQALFMAARRRRRRRWLAGIAAVVVAAAAVGICAGLGVVVAGRVTGPAQRHGAGARAGLPRYYLEQSNPFTEQGVRRRTPPVTVVRSTATGAVTARVHCSWKHAVIALAGIAAAGHQVFFIVCEKRAWPGGYTSATGSRIYRFQVTGAGQVSGYSPVPGGVLPGLAVFGIAASADASTIAVSTVRGAQGRGGGLEPPAIIVINTRTGAHAAWYARTGGHQTISVLPPVGGDSLSLTGDGRELVFVGQPVCSPRCKATGEEVRAVSPAAGGGQLASSRVLFRQSALTGPLAGPIYGAVVSPSGSALTVLDLGRQAQTVSVIQVPAATGRHLRVLYRVITGGSLSYQLFSADPSRRYLLLDVGPFSGAANGWIDHGRLARLRPNGDSVFYETW